jgi:hypothetical protein
MGFGCLNPESAVEIIPFFAMDPELFDFHLFRFSFGETTEEVIRKRKSKSYRKAIISDA